MRMSISLTNFSWRGTGGLGAHLAEVARAADDASLDTIWVPDHLVQADPTVPETDTEMYESQAVLAFLAGQTSRVRLGTLVANATLRPPAVLVQSVSTIAALSGGRAWLGVGTGYAEEEATDLGVPLPPVPERYDQLEDLLEIAHRLWSGDESPYDGRRNHLARPRLSPRPEPRPSILVGGTGERRTLGLVARYADACNLFDIPDEGATIRRKVQTLSQHCERIGRPMDEIDVTLSTRLGAEESVEQLAQRCERMARLGVRHLIFVSSPPWGVPEIELIGRAGRLHDDQES